MRRRPDRASLHLATTVSPGLSTAMAIPGAADSSPAAARGGRAPTRALLDRGRLRLPRAPLSAVGLPLRSRPHAQHVCLLAKLLAKPQALVATHGHVASRHGGVGGSPVLLPPMSASSPASP
eukprot:7964001-Pyramimonas_sp.AAC.1